MRLTCHCIALSAWLVAASWAPAMAAPVKLTLVETSDLYKMSEENGRGGMARLAAILKAERAGGKHVLFVHAGDAFSPSLMSGFDHGSHMVALLNALKPDIFVPGNHEFDFGKDDYLKRVSEAQFAFLAANLRTADGKRLDKHEDHRFLDIEGVRIGITGAALDDTPRMSSPGDLKFGPLIDTVAAEVTAMKVEAADLTIAVIHADAETDRRLLQSHAADVLLSGHDHDLRLAYDGKSMLAESGSDAQYVVVTELTLDKRVKDGKSSFSWWPNFRIVDTASVTPDPDMTALVKAYEADLGKELDVPLAKLDAGLDTRSASSRSGETAFGNLVADAIRAATGAVVALTNGGGIRGNKEYAAGQALTRRDVLTELPFGNKTVMIRLTGADILAALENGLGKLPDTSGRFPQVSGMTVVADLAKPAGSRVVSLDIGGTPVDPAAKYTLATQDFLLGGGDGYTMFGKSETIRDADAGMLIANDVMVLARKLGHLAGKVEGRIVLKR